MGQQSTSVLDAQVLQRCAACQLPLKSLTDYAFVCGIKPDQPQPHITAGIVGSSPTQCCCFAHSGAGVDVVGGVPWCLESCGLTTPPFYEPKELA